MITAVRDEWKIVRNSSFFKKIPDQGCRATTATSRPRSDPDPKSSVGRRMTKFPTARPVPTKNVMVALPILPPDQAVAERVLDRVDVVPGRHVEIAEDERDVTEDRQDQESSDSDTDAYVDADEGANDARLDVPPIDFFRLPENLSIPTQSFNIPRDIRNAPNEGAPAFNTRSRTSGVPD